MDHMSLYLQILAFIFLRVYSDSSVLPPYFPQYTPKLQLLFLAVIQGSEFNIFLHRIL